MKKIILSSLLVLVMCFTNAQKTQFGIKGGLISSNFSGDTNSVYFKNIIGNLGVDFKSGIGFNVGVFAAIKLSDKITVQPEILYSKQGAEVSNVTLLLLEDIATIADFDVNLSYINVPIMIKYYVANKLNLEVGPQIGFLISSKSSGYVDGWSEKLVEDGKDSFESVDFGLNFGAGYDFTKNVSAGIRYSLGLANIAKTAPVDNSELKNSVLSLSVGYKF